MQYISITNIKLVKLNAYEIKQFEVNIALKRLVTKASESKTVMAYLCPFLVLVLASSASAQDYVDECPEPNGFYADAVQCDRYYECKNSQVGTAMSYNGQYNIEI